MYDAQDRLLAYGDLEFQYNSNGDLIAQIQHSGQGGDSETQYTYDVFGNLKAVALPDGKRITYIVDGQNRRVGKKINGVLVQGFIYQNQTQIAAELDGRGNIVQQYIYGEKANVPDYMIMNGQEFRIISDQVGTPKLIVDLNGNVVARLSFDEFGVPGDPSATSHIPFGFAGGIYDPDTGLVRFGARDYNPVVGRWTTKDSILFGGSGTNLYGYAVNDPVNLIDPSGRQLAPIIGIVVVGISLFETYVYLSMSPPVMLPPPATGILVLPGQGQCTPSNPLGGAIAPFEASPPGARFEPATSSEGSLPLEEPEYDEFEEPEWSPPERVLPRTPYIPPVLPSIDMGSKDGP